MTWLLSHHSCQSTYPMLQLSQSSSRDIDIQKSVSLANTILSSSKAITLFVNEFKLVGSDIKRAASVSIKFDDNVATDYAWVMRSRSAKVIHLNRILRKRLDKGKSDEREVIIFFIALSLIHELAHLILKWHGFICSPEKFNEEAGRYAEVSMFNGIACLVVQKGSANKKWNASMRIRSVVIKRLDGYKQVIPEFVRQQVDPRTRCKPDDMFPFEVTSYTRHKGAYVVASKHGAHEPRRSARGVNLSFILPDDSMILDAGCGT